MTDDNTAIRVGVRELRENLSAYMRQVQGGALVHVTSHNKVIAELRPPPVEIRPRRLPGALKGKIWMAPDFDETPEDIIDAMEADI
ncbi:MAG: prevent-host-death protein [Acetobacteraceae bacterium]|nr:prevent-host-death protein [Acetobacteraceae bacterium]